MSQYAHPRREFLCSALAASVGGILLRGAYADEKQAAKKPPIKVAQIGTGHAHASKLSVFRASPDYEVVGVAESDPELRKKAQVAGTLSRPALDDAGRAAQHTRLASGPRRNPRSRPADHGRSLRRRGQAHPSRQAGRRIAAAVPPDSRLGRQAKTARADGLHVPLQPGRRAAAGLSPTRAGWARCSRSTR